MFSPISLLHNLLKPETVRETKECVGRVGDVAPYDAAKQFSFVFNT